MSDLRLPRLWSDGVVIQMYKPVHVWGWADNGSKVTCTLKISGSDNKSESAVCSDSGRFDVTFDVSLEPGTKLELKVSDGSDELTVKDILTGEVWLTTGQSNMDLTFDRLKDNYPDVIARSENDNIRSFDITSDSCYSGPLEDNRTGEWRKACPGNMHVISGTSYFFAKHIYDALKIPVGIIHASLGGSHIYCWMDKEMLAGYPELLEEASKYADPAFIKEVEKKNAENGELWIGATEENDKGRTGKWENGLPEGETGTIELPDFFDNDELKGMRGVVWFEKKFTADSSIANIEAKIWLGTISDSDEVYVNGVFVGTTGYQYPPRKYEIPRGVIKEGENSVVVRVRVDGGQGRITRGKRLMIFNKFFPVDPWSNSVQEGAVDLSGTWNYKVGCKLDLEVAPTDFINWKATGLFNCMTAPATNMPIQGVVWYQGESDADIPDKYKEFTRLQVEGYRRLWKDENLPYIFAQLPNWTDSYDIPEEGNHEGWADFRQVQTEISQEIPGVYMAITMDAGEDNDLHPMDKYAVGTRLAKIALCKCDHHGHVYDYQGQLEDYGAGPKPESVASSKSGKGYEITLKFSNCGLEIIQNIDPDSGKDSAITDFSVEAGGKIYPVRAEVTAKDTVKLYFDKDIVPEKVRYLQKSTNTGAMLYNMDDDCGLELANPLAPFIAKI